jgi:hypothetical protein
MVAVAEGFSIGFAVALLVTGAAFYLAANGRLARRTASILAAVIGSASVAGWIALVYDPDLALAVAAAGLTACALSMFAAVGLSRLVRRGQQLDADYARAEKRIRTMIDKETSDRALELERTLARARADSISKLAEEERRIGEEHRRALVGRESKTRDELAAALSAAQQQVERRFVEWSQDLERIQEQLAGQISGIPVKQRELVAHVESRLTADAERIQAESEEQRAAVARLREELARSIEEVAQTANAELESQAADRRRALHEVADRLQRREEALREQIEREETEAARRITAGFAEIERRQLEQLQRVIDRATSGFSELATQQFEDEIKGAQEDAARRLARELERAVASFERDARGVLSDQLAQIADSGSQRLEKRLGQIAAGLERQRDDAVAALERRFAEIETESRARVQSLIAEVDAERTVIEARLQELSRRIDEAFARSR